MDLHDFIGPAVTLLGGGALVQVYNSYIGKPKIKAEAEKALAEAAEAKARADKLIRESLVPSAAGPDQITIETLLKTLAGLQDQLGAQAKLFADREAAAAAREQRLLTRIDEMENELVELRVRNGKLIEQVADLKALVAENGRKADKAASFIITHMPGVDVPAAPADDDQEPLPGMFPPG